MVNKQNVFSLQTRTATATTTTNAVSSFHNVASKQNPSNRLSISDSPNTIQGRYSTTSISMNFQNHIRQHAFTWTSAAVVVIERRRSRGGGGSCVRASSPNECDGGVGWPENFARWWRIQADGGAVGWCGGCFVI